MIKYKKPISIAKGGRSLSFANPETGRVTTVDIKENPPEDNVDQAYVNAPAVTIGSLGTGKAVWEWFKNWNAQSASTVSNALPKTLSTIGKVAGPLGTAAMILTPAQTNVGEDELFRNPSSPFYRGRLVTESSDEQASGEQTNESATTEEGAAAGTVSNPQENPNKKKEEKKEDNKDKKDEEKRTHFKTFTQKIKNGKNSVDQFWGNRANWWETSTNSSATPLVRGFHNWITRPVVAYEFIREGIPGIIEAGKVLGGVDNTFDPRPLWGYPRLLPKIQSDSVSSQTNNVSSQTNKPQQVYTTNIDTTAINNQISNSDSLQNIINKRNGY